MEKAFESLSHDPATVLSHHRPKCQLASSPCLSCIPPVSRRGSGTQKSGLFKYHQPPPGPRISFLLSYATLPPLQRLLFQIRLVPEDQYFDRSGKLTLHTHTHNAPTQKSFEVSKRPLRKGGIERIHPKRMLKGALT